MWAIRAASMVEGNRCGTGKRARNCRCLSHSRTFVRGREPKDSVMLVRTRETTNAVIRSPGLEFPQMPRGSARRMSSARGIARVLNESLVCSLLASAMIVWATPAGAQAFPVPAANGSQNKGENGEMAKSAIDLTLTYNSDLNA